MGFAAAGVGDLIASIIAPAAAAEAVAAPEEIAAGAIALPEIAVTAAAPEVAAGVGAGVGADVGLGAIGAAGAGLAGADLVGGAGAGAFDLGLTGGAGADLTGGAIGAAAPVATEGVTALPEAFGGAVGAGSAVAPGGGGLLSAQEALAGGPTGPLATLSQPDFPGTFGQFGQTAPDISGPTAQDTALSFAPTDTSVTPANPLADIPAGPDPFATAPPAVEGQIPGQVASALTTGGGEFPPTGYIPAPGAVTAVDAPTIPFSTAGGTTPPVAPTAVGYAPGSPEAAVAGSTAVPGGGVTAAPGGGGITGALSNVLASPWTKAAELGAPLAFLGYNLLKGPAPLPPAEQQALQNAGMVGGFGTQQLQLAQANQITPAQSAQIDIFTQNAKNALYQKIVNEGQDPRTSSEYALGLQAIDQQALAMRQQFINAMITNGISAVGAADTALQAAANMQVANDNAFNNAVAGSLQSLALMGVLTSKAA
jgi:hypothetical protein